MMELITASFIAFCGLLGALLRYAPFAKNILKEQKQKVFFCYGVLYLLYTGVLTAFLHYLGMTAAIRCLQVGGNLFSLAVLIPNLCIIRGRFREHIFLLGMVVTCQYLMLSIPAYIVSFDKSLSPFMLMCAFFGLYGVLLLITFFPMRKLMKRTVEPFLELSNHNYWDTICFVPLAFFFGMMFFLWGTDTVSDLLQMVSSMFSGSMLIFMCLSIASDNKRIQERETIKKQLDTQKTHYTELKVRVEDARKTIHDFKHHIAAIRHFMDSDDKEGLRSYCDELVERTSGKGRIPYTGNMAADGVFYEYIKRAEQEKIHFQYSGTIRSPGVSDADLCVLLGNALENAFTACQSISENRNVTVICQSEQQLLSVVVHNSFDGKVIQSHGTLLSRKRKNEPGIGLVSMQAICQRYGGSMETRWDESTFTVMFILPLETET